MNFRFPLTGLLAATALCGAALSPARAQTVTLNAQAFGIYERFGVGEAFHSSTPDVYRTGQFTPPPNPVLSRSFFVFNISAPLGFTVTGATLRIVNTGTNDSPDANETLTIFPVVTPVATLISGGAGQRSSIFDDLGNGTALGSVVIPTNPPTLTPGAIVSVNVPGLVGILNGLGTGQVAVGASLTSLGNNAESVFSNIQNNTTPNAQLVLTGTQVTAAPEPATLALLLCAPAVIGTVVRRRHHKA